MGKSTLRSVFDRVERAVGAPLEQAIATESYGDFIVFWLKGPAAVNRMVRKSVDRQLGRVLHMLNMPTREDYTRMTKQLAVLTAELRALAAPTDAIVGYVADRQRHEIERDPVRSIPVPNELTDGKPPGTARPTRAKGQRDGA